MILPPDYLENPEFQRLEAVFHEYVAQGDGRNPTWLTNKTGLPLATVCRGMVKGQWMARIAAVGSDAARKTQELVGDVAGMNSRDVAELATIASAAGRRLMEAIERDEVSPTTLARIYFDAKTRIRDILGLGQGMEGDLASRLNKLLEGSSTGDAKPFELDESKIAAPVELPAMPGMTSDAEILSDDEKEMLRGPDD